MNTFSKQIKRLAMVMAVALGVTAFAGCDETAWGIPDLGIGNLGLPMDFGLPTDFGVGPIDWDVFNDANDAWSDYFRE